MVVPWRAPDFVHCPVRRPVRRPQLKRDPLGGDRIPTPVLNTVKTVRPHLWLCSTVVLACSLAEAKRSDAPQGNRLAFLVSTITPAGRDTTFRSDFWNGAVHLDTVSLSLVDGSSILPIDSIVLQGRSGPLHMLDDLPSASEADSLGRYARFPRSLLARRTPKTTGPLGAVIATIDVPAGIDWTRRNIPAMPYLTRLRVTVWQSGRPTQAELGVAHPD